MADKSTDETYPKREGVADSLTPSTEIEEAEVYNVPECPEPILESDTQEVKEKRAACVNFSKHFHLKTGQKIVVVDSEDEVLNEKDVKTKYCVLGSRDHVLALKSKVKELANKAQEAEAEKEAALKRCENVGQQLDTLVSELQQLDSADGTDSSEQTIHATIHTFGHIRKLEIIPDEDEHQYDRLIRRPKTRQYFKGDTLHRGAEERRTSYTELFWDLIFVGAIGLMGHELVHKPDGFHLEQFVLTFIPLYKVWNDVHFYLNVWASEDLVQKFFILWEMVCVIGMTISAVHSTGYVNDEGVVVSTFNQFVGCYLLARLTIAFVYFIFCFFMPKFRIYLLYNIFGNVFSCILWAVSLGMPIASREQANVIWYAIIVDWLWNTAYPAAMKYWPHDKIFCIQKPLYRAAVNIEHMADRLGLFVIITLGESVIALLYSTWSSNINTQAAKGVLGLLLAYNLHWIYFDVDASRQYKHALRRHIFTGLLFVFLHLPLCAAIVIMGSTLGVLVQVMDFPGSENIPVGLHGAERLTEIPPGIDWLFCGSLSMAICCLATIGLSHQSMDAVDLMKIHKRWRISFRYVTAAIFAVLPLAKLNSLSLLAIVSSLSLVLVIVETVGRLRRTGRSDKEKQGGDIEQGEESNVEDRGLWVRWSSHFRSRSTNDITSALQWTSTFSSSRTLNMSGPTDDGSRRRWFSQNSRSSLDEKKHGVKGAPFEMCI